MILDDVAMRVCPLLPTRQFVDYCVKRNLRITPEQLHRYEEQRIFKPVIRVVRPEGANWILRYDGSPSAPDFAEGFVIDASAPDANYAVPDLDDQSSGAFYSQFQVMSLRHILRQLTLPVLLDKDMGATDWDERIRQLSEYAKKTVDRFREDHSLAAIPLLCQLISNRYLPYAIGNQRSNLIRSTTQWGGWIQFDSGDWDWSQFRRSWDPSFLVAPFSMDEMSLKRIHENIVLTMRSFDPLWAWSDLVRFVNQDNRDKLQGDALCAESYRQSAAMLRLLYRDLFGTDFDPPGDTSIWLRSHLADLPALDDRRERLRYVVNEYGLNPQPKAVLLVEGESEVAFISRYVQLTFGSHFANLGIDIVNLRGVGNATGNKASDKFGAIFRLVDYLHEQQTLCFIMLDNEGQAKNLKKAAKDRASIFQHRSRVMPQSHIRIWDRDFEFDNFNDCELAKALSEIADGTEFLPEQVEKARSECKSGVLPELFRRRTGVELNKPSLAQHLAGIAATLGSASKPRPVTEFLDQVYEAAVMNPFPVDREVWLENQKYLDSTALPPEH